MWAPSARSVSVVGDFNSWDGRLHPMRSLGSSGIWELFLPGVGAGARYKYEILSQATTWCSRPIPRPADRGAAQDGLGRDRSSHQWSDDAQLLKAGGDQQPLIEPVSIYEVHLGSWRLNSLEHNRPLTYASWPTSSRPTSPTWASPTSSCCR